MINFIPLAFTGENDECPVCVARLQFEAAAEVSVAVTKLAHDQLTAGGADASVLLAWKAIPELFQAMMADYRVSFAVNLAIWFSAERFGRVKKVPDLILAYAEYREQSGNSLRALKQAYEAFAAASAGFREAEAIKASHDDLINAAELFWTEVDKWTKKRHEDAFSLL